MILSQEGNDGKTRPSISGIYRAEIEAKSNLEPERLQIVELRTYLQILWILFSVWAPACLESLLLDLLV